MQHDHRLSNCADFQTTGKDSKAIFSYSGPSCLADWCSSSLHSALDRARDQSSANHFCELAGLGFCAALYMQAVMMEVDVHPACRSPCKKAPTPKPKQKSALASAFYSQNWIRRCLYWAWSSLGYEGRMLRHPSALA